MPDSEESAAQAQTCTDISSVLFIFLQHDQGFTLLKCLVTSYIVFYRIG